MASDLVLLGQADCAATEGRVAFWRDLILDSQAPLVITLGDLPGWLGSRIGDSVILPLPRPSTLVAAERNLALLRRLVAVAAVERVLAGPDADVQAEAFLGSPLQSACEKRAVLVVSPGADAVVVTGPEGLRRDVPAAVGAAQLLAVLDDPDPAQARALWPLPPLPAAKLETPAPSQLFADSLLVLRGWVDQPVSPITSVVVEAPGLRLELPLDQMRADVVDERRLYRVAGFEGRIDLINHPCKLLLTFSLLHANGQLQPWQTVEVWHPEMRPLVPSRTVLGLDWSHQGPWVVGQIRGAAADDDVSLWQAGRRIATARLGPDGAFRLRAEGFDPLRDAFLWHTGADGQATFLDRIPGEAQIFRHSAAYLQRFGSASQAFRRQGLTAIDVSPGHGHVVANGRRVEAASLSDGSARIGTDGLSDTLWVERTQGDPRRGVFLNQGLRWVHATREAVMAKRLVLLETTDGARSVFAPCAIEHGPDGFVLLGLRNGHQPLVEIPVTALRDLRPIGEPFQVDAAVQAEIQAFRMRFAEAKEQSARAAPQPVEQRRLVLPTRMATALPATSGRCILLRPDHSPTDDLYVTAAMELIGRRHGWSYSIIDLRDPVPLDDPQAIRPGDFVVVSRYITEPWFQRLAKLQGRIRIAYLMDDDVAAAIDTPALRMLYRQRMDEVALLDFQAMLRLADHVVVTSENLLRTYNSPKTRMLHPPCLRFPLDMVHQDMRRPIRFAYHGTDGHLEDINFLAPVLGRLAQKFGSRIEVEIFTSFRWPTTLSNIRFVKPKPWADYVAHAARHPAHVAVVPLLFTPYNAGKSIIKVHDTTSLGAVGVYSRTDPYTGVVRDGEDGLLVANDPGLWYQALKLLTEQGDFRRGMAIRAQERAQSDFSAAATAGFWETVLDLP
jgi:hypothetical protein